MNMNGLAGYFRPMALRETLLRLMKEQGLSSISLARKAGMSDSHLRKVMAGSIKTPHSKLQQIAKALGVTTEELLPAGAVTSSIGARLTRVDHDEPRVEHSVLVPVEGVAVGGNPSELGEVKDEEFPLQHHLHRPWRKVVRVYGESMYPELHSNDLVLIDPKEKVIDGDIALVRVEGETTIKRVFRSKKKGVTLKADNPRFPPIFPDDEAFEILGKVIQLVERKL